MGLLQTGCTPVEPVMSKAGVMTHPDCAKYSTEEAVATCETEPGAASPLGGLGSLESVAYEKSVSLG